MRQDLSIHQRQSHLESMGVAQWYSRTALLGAKPSPEDLFEEDVSGPQSSSSVQAQSAPKDLLKSLKSRQVETQDSGLASDTVPPVSLNSTDIMAPTGAAVVEGVAASSSEQAVLSDENLSSHVSKVEGGELSPVGAFSINCYLSTEYIVISECSNQSGVRRESLLLVNIFKSLASLKHASPELGYCQSFNWPVFHSLNLQSSQSAELNNAIKLWLEGVLSQQKTLFYFGSGHAALRELVKDHFSGLSFYSFKYSLQDMLQIPIRKKEIWVELQAYSF